MKVILAINAGSSSVKISVYSVQDRHASPHQIAEAQVSGLTSPPTKLTYTRGNGEGEVVHKGLDVKAKTQDDAFNILLDTLINDPSLHHIASKDDIAITCHRIVHGGDYDTAQVITRDTYHHIEALSDLAPLHNGAALGIVDSCVRQLPASAVNIACFDSQFHASIPPHIYTYPIDQEIARKNGLRKYGFHGLSYSFITRSVAEFLGKDVDKLNIIALHLGSGASACAVKGGKSWDTSMGLTPLAGLPGATRSGSVDPSLVFHYASDVGKLSPSSTEKLHISRAEEILNKQSGWSALTGTTNFAVIADKASSSSNSNPSEKEKQVNEYALAFDIFVDRVSAFVGSYYVSLAGRVDALVFAGGIGERSAKLREAVVRNASCLGFAIDESLNRNWNNDNVVGDISAAAAAGSGSGGENARHKVLVCQTDEQFEMARMCTAMNDVWD